MVTVVSESGKLLILLHGAVHNIIDPFLFPLLSLQPPQDRAGV